jgi:hypothetical protein
VAETPRFAAHTDPRDATIARITLAGRGTSIPPRCVLEQSRGDAAVGERRASPRTANAFPVGATMRRKVDLLRKATLLASVQG